MLFTKGKNLPAIMKYKGNYKVRVIPKLPRKE